MLNFDTKDKALDALKSSVKEHESIREQVKQVSIKLFNERKKVADEVIKTAEAYVNTLANSPKEFEKTVAEFRYQVNCFRNAIRQLHKKAAKAVKVGAGSGAAGVAAGVGVATLAPTAAMAIAKTPWG